MYKYILWDIDGTVLDFLASEAYAIRFLTIFSYQRMWEKRSLIRHILIMCSKSLA